MRTKFATKGVKCQSCEDGKIWKIFHFIHLEIVKLIKTTYSFIFVNDLIDMFYSLFIHSLYCRMWECSSSLSSWSCWPSPAECPTCSTTSPTEQMHGLGVVVLQGYSHTSSGFFFRYSKFICLYFLTPLILRLSLGCNYG